MFSVNAEDISETSEMHALRFAHSNARLRCNWRILQIYPELRSGRVVADAEVGGLGDYFTGERALVWISAGKRRTITVPGNFVFKRFGLDYARLARGKQPPLDIVV